MTVWVCDVGCVRQKENMLNCRGENGKDNFRIQSDSNPYFADTGKMFLIFHADMESESDCVWMRSRVWF